MKRIYKRIEVASAEILLTLALFSDVGGTESVDAADLDRLEAQLSRPNYTGAEQLPVANVQRSHLEITNEGEVLAVLHRLKRGENIFVCKARYGTNISVQLTIDFVVTDPNETTPVEISENVVLVESIGDGGGGGEFPTDYAKQGDDPTATLTDTQAYAQSAAEDAAAAKTAAQALSPVASAADAYNTGKVELAANITAKGVEASASETLPQLAQKVTAIAQQPIILSPSEVGDMYAVQQFGSLTTPNYWNLYEVLNTLLNDGRLLNYGGILLAEYYRGYDSLTLSGAGAGGAYVVSDMENGVFKMYTEDTTHTWSTEFDGKGNRWVAYCFADEYHDFQITNTNTSPHSIFIGRKVGTITSLTNGRVSQIVVPDGNSLNCFTGGYTQYWAKNTVVRGLKDQSGTLIHNPNTSIESLYVSVEKVTGALFTNVDGGVLSSLILNVRSMDKVSIFPRNSGTVQSLSTLIIDGVESCSGYFRLSGDYAQNADWDFTAFTILKRIAITNTEQFTIYLHPTAGSILPVLRSFYIGYNTNDKSKSISVICAGQTINDVELQDGCCKPLVLTSCNLTEDGETNNITEHILKRLKQDEPDCGDGVTITLGQTNLDKLTSAESISLLDDLTNIYGYTFA